MKLLHHHLKCHLGKNDPDKVTMQTTSKVKGVDIGVVGIMAEDMGVMEANMEEVITEEVEGVTMGVEEEIRIEGLFRMQDGKRIIKPKIMNANTICLYLNNEFNGNEPETKDNHENCTYSRICPLIDHLVVDLSCFRVMWDMFEKTGISRFALYHRAHALTETTTTSE